jgi:hypothetical protein
MHASSDVHATFGMHTTPSMHATFYTQYPGFSPLMLTLVQMTTRSLWFTKKMTEIGVRNLVIMIIEGAKQHSHLALNCVYTLCANDTDAYHRTYAPGRRFGGHLSQHFGRSDQAPRGKVYHDCALTAMRCYGKLAWTASLEDRISQLGNATRSRDFMVKADAAASSWNLNRFPYSTAMMPYKRFATFASFEPIPSQTVIS